MKGRSHRLQNSSDPPDDWVDGSWTVDCVCGVNFDDGEEMVNCDECGVWVHTRCSRYVKGEELFACDKCKNKNNRNDSEETEVAQLLVELPTKTMRTESSYPTNGPPRRPFRLWTDIPMEERVHVQGIPGGDPTLFRGLSSVFTPELWKCTGYVPKKFNFQYREFPCWDEEDKTRNEEENENPVDEGAGVLFSLSKESVLATPVAALVGMRGGDEDSFCGRRAFSKEIKKWEGKGLDARRMQNGMEERNLLQSDVMHSGKRKKEDLGTTKDRSGKKKARAAEREADAKRRGVHAPKIVFTPTSDAKPLEFYEDRGSKALKIENHSIEKGNSRDTVPLEPVMDGHLAVDNTVERPKNNLATMEYPSEAFSSDVLGHNISNGPGLKEEDKADHPVPTGVVSSSKTDDVTASLLKHNNAGSVPIEEEGDSVAVDNLDDSVDCTCRSVVKFPVEGLAGAALEVKDNQKLQNLAGDMLMSSIQPSFEVKTEVDDNNSREVLNFQSSPVGHAKLSGISSELMAENSKVNDAAVISLHCSDQKAHDVDRNSSPSDCHTHKANELSGEPSQIKRELDGSEGSVAVQKSSSVPKHGSLFPDEQSKLGGTISSSQTLPSRCKMVVCVGKSSSTSSNGEIFKSSASNDLKPADNQNPNSITKQQVMSECKISIKKDHAASDVVRDEDGHEMVRKTVKEHPKNSVLKASHLSRISHPKNSVFSSSSKASSAQNIVVTSCPGEPTNSMQNQSSLHEQNKIPSSGLPQRGEKFNQTSKWNHTSSMHPAPTASPAATLSDEELALRLHQELNSSPRVPRPRVRHASSIPQLASPTATSMLIKRTSSSGGKDHSSVSKRKTKDVPKDGFRSSHEIDDEGKKTQRVPPSPDQRRHDLAYAAEASTKGEDSGSLAVGHSVKNNDYTTTANSGPSSSTEVNDHNTSSIRNSPRNISDEDAGTVGGPVHRTLPGLINEIMSKGRRMTYEELCNAVLPHWHNLRKHNGERYAYSSHSHAVLDCLRNRHEWARLVDRGPKTNSSRKRRKHDTEPPNAESEDNEYGKGRTAKEVEGKSLESQREEFTKGKRKARKRRRLALQGRGIKDIRKRRKVDLQTDDDIGPFSNSSDGSVFSDEIQGGGTCLMGSEASASSDETGTM